MFKKLVLLMVIVALVGSYAMAVDKVYFEKIGSSSNQWEAKYAVVANVDDYLLRLDELMFGKNMANTINNTAAMKKIDNIDINRDSINDWVITVLTGRGTPDLFYIIDGKTHKVIFHHLKCREGLTYTNIVDKLVCEGRGSRKFKHSSGSIQEIVDVPFDKKVTNEFANKIANNPKSQYYKQSLALIKDNICIMGQYNYFYIWDKDKYKFILSKKEIKYHYFDQGDNYI